MFEEDSESKFLRYAGIAVAIAAALWLGSYLIRSGQNTADMQTAEEMINALPRPN